jgi:solute carrier family 8 (sodium/calcium exchanger)
MSGRRFVTITEEQLYNYTCSDRGLLLPLVNEYTWSKATRAGLYLVAMLYCFLGIALIADIFMCAILKIISKTRTVSINGPCNHN